MCIYTPMHCHVVQTPPARPHQSLEKIWAEEYKMEAMRSGEIEPLSDRLSLPPVAICPVCDHSAPLCGLLT